jgi:hypothetical protein
LHNVCIRQQELATPRILWLVFAWPHATVLNGDAWHRANVLNDADGAFCHEPDVRGVREASQRVEGVVYSDGKLAPPTFLIVHMY